MRAQIEQLIEKIQALSDRYGYTIPLGPLYGPTKDVPVICTEHAIGLLRDQLAALPAPIPQEDLSADAARTLRDHAWDLLDDSLKIRDYE